MNLSAKVLTVSDGVVAGTRDDSSGRALVDQLREAGFDVTDHRVTADGAGAVAAALTELAAFRGQEPVARRLDDLADHRDAMTRAASEALQHGPDAETIEAVTVTLGLVEACLRARSASASY